jgi:6-phosphofructokinase 1
MYVQGINEIPEIRSVVPGHLVRCGRSSAYDVNFGKEAGAAAVTLIKNGIYGVTIAGIQDGEVRYMKAAEAIKQRHVNTDQVKFYEQMGVCFGRKPQAVTNPKFKELSGSPERYM